MAFPIESQALEFIDVKLLESPLCGYDYLAKISFTKNFDKAAFGDSFTLHKWVIDPTDPDVAAHLESFSTTNPILTYMSLCKYMSTTTYMGGLSLLEDLEAIHTSINITGVFLAGRDYVLDPIVDTNLIVLYNVQYTYSGVCYWTDFTGSYLPIPREQYEKRLRPCISGRNLRYRGINESAKYSDTFREISNDIFYLYNEDSELNAVSDTLLPSETTMLSFLDLHEKYAHTIGE
jgi:hypothetical protein